VPFTHAFPWQILGSTAILSFQSMTASTIKIARIRIAGKMLKQPMRSELEAMENESASRG
jgi:hypothetical protein